MNEKIMELAAQAEEYMEIPMHDDVYHMGDDIFRRHKILNREKFAELIVQECAKLVEDNMDPQNAWITPAFIKEHFGVEE